MPTTPNLPIDPANYGWKHTGVGYEKDGYEIYYKKDGGFELTIRNPVSKERIPVIERGDLSNNQPLAIAMLCHIIENAETIVSEIDNDNGNN